MNTTKKSTINNFINQFNKFFSMFEKYFFVYRRDNAPAAKSYLSGLVQSIPRKNIERMNEHVPACTYDAQHHFITHSPWKYAPLNRHIAQYADTRIGGTKSVLIIDESAFSKAGNASVGVARQYNGRLGKIDNC